MINLSNFLGLSEGMKLYSSTVKYMLCFSGINVHNDGGIDTEKVSAGFVRRPGVALKSELGYGCHVGWARPY